MHFVNVPNEVRVELHDSLAECRTAAQARDIDFAMVFTKSKSELTGEFARMSKLLAQAGMLWVSWPKKSSGIPTELTEDDVREIGLAAGLVDVKVCAVTDIWSGLKFVRRVKDREKQKADAENPR